MVAESSRRGSVSIARERAYRRNDPADATCPSKRKITAIEEKRTLERMKNTPAKGDGSPWNRAKIAEKFPRNNETGGSKGNPDIKTASDYYCEHKAEQTKRYTGKGIRTGCCA